MSTHLPKSEIISLQESLRYFITSDQAVLFLLNQTPEEATQFVQTCLKEAKLLADCFYCEADATLDTEGLSQHLQRLGLMVSLPNFSSGAQLQFCLEQVNALKTPSVLVIDRADELPPMTLTSLYQLALEQMSPLRLHIILVGAKGLEKVAEPFNQSESRPASVTLYFDPNDEALEDPSIDVPNIPPRTSFWQKHKIKTISLILLIILLFSFQRVAQHLNESLNGLSEHKSESLPIPTANEPTPQPSLPKAVNNPTRPNQIKPVAVTQEPKPDATHSKTADNLAPKVSANLGTQPTPDNEDAFGWPNEPLPPQQAAEKNPTPLPIQTTPKKIDDLKLLAEKPVATPTAPSVYTIQWIASFRKETVQRFQSQHHLENETFIESKTNHGKTWYFLLEGKFTSPHEAAASMATLKQKIPGTNPWVRKWSAQS